MAVAGDDVDPQLVEKGPWSCLDRPIEPAAPRADSAVVRIQACNFVSTNCSEPAGGITAALCDKKDVTCANPIQPNITDVNGTLVFDVPTGGILGVGSCITIRLAMVHSGVMCLACILAVKACCASFWTVAMELSRIAAGRNAQTGRCLVMAS